jgi:hypothetical protein
MSLELPTTTYYYYYYYQSPSSFCLIAFDRALNASANPPASPPVVGVDVPLSVPLPPGAPGAGLRPTGLFAGGGGGIFLPAKAPFALGGAGGTDRACTGGGGGGAGLTIASSRYADGAHPDAEPSNRFASHQPKNNLLAFYFP